MTPYSARRLATGGIFALTALAFAVFFIFTPYSGDDFWFRHLAMDQYFATGSFGFPGELIRMEMLDHIRHDNARLCNILFCILVYLPRWITATVTAALCTWLLRALARLAGIGRADWQKTVWLCAMFAMALPWVEHLFTLCFQLNYLWSMAGAAWIACRVLFGRPLHPVLAFAVGLLFGAWHEGFSVPVFAGLCALAVCFPSRFRRRDTAAMLAGMAIGIAWLAFCPAALYRGEGGTRLSEPYYWLLSLRYNFLICIYFILWLAALARRKTRAGALTPLSVFTATCCAVSYLIGVYAAFGMRPGMCGEMFAIAGILRLWPAESGSRVRVALSGLMGIFLIAHLAVASAMTFRVRGEYDTLYKQYRRSTDGRVFTRLTSDLEAPLLALGKPLFLYQESLLCQGLTHSSVSKPLLPVPELLADATAQSGRDVPGMPGLRMFDGRFFAPADSLGLPLDCWTDLQTQVMFGPVAHPRVVRAIPFTSRADGREYFYLYINGRMPLERIRPANAIYW